MSKITIKNDSSVNELLTLLSSRTSTRAIAQSLVGAVADGSIHLAGLAVKERFTGQGPFPVPQKRLGVVSGRLKRDIRFSKPRVAAGGKITVEAGSNVKYWARHEFGGRGRKFIVPAHKVRSHDVRNFMGTGETVKVKAHERKAYQRIDNMPAREPLQAAIREHGGRVYSREIEKALIKLIEQKS